MSLILRQLLRDPLVTRPISRALRRYDDDWFLNDWPARKARRMVQPEYESPIGLMNEMNRQMSAAMSQMQEMANELDNLDELVGRSLVNQENELPRKRLKREAETIVRRTESGGLQLALDVDGFKPEELKIKLVDDNLVVEASSETSGEDSYRRSQFKRWFKLPEDCKLEDIKSKLTGDNRLLIDLPSSKPPLEQRTRSIPIEMEKKSAADSNKQVEDNNKAPSMESGKASKE